MAITTRVGKGLPLTHEELDANFAACMGVHNFLHVQDRKTTTGGGTFTAGAWRQRTLQTVVENNILGASLATNQISLPIGNYFCLAEAYARQVNTHILRLYSITAASSIICGGASYAYSAYYAQNAARLFGSFSLDQPATIELQHISEATLADNGFGFASLLGQDYTVFADVKIWKLS